MALFSRARARSSSPADLPVEAPPAGDWSIGQGKLGGKPVFVRWDQAAARACPNASLPVKVTIGVQYPQPRPDGLPSPSDLVMLEEMERALFSELPQVAGAKPVLVLTTNGMREWIVYAADHAWLPTWAPGYEHRFLVSSPGKITGVIEPDWATFREWCPAA